MRRRRGMVGIVATVVAALACAAGTAASASAGDERGTPATGCAAVAGDQAAWVECMLAGMTTEQKIGQMFVVNGFGQTADATDSASVTANRTMYGPDVSNLDDLIAKYQPGGVVYFNWSNTLSSPSQVASLSNGVQRAALAQPVPTPMLTSIDQEQGEVTRITSPATVFPGNMALGAARSTKLTFQNAAITGRELAAMGINVDNAPVVDVNTNPLNIADGIRAFGDQTPFVAKHGVAAVEGYEQGAGISAVAKHWPGLGGTSTNPDDGITVSDQSLAELREAFPAFEAAIDAGVDSIMVTHIETPNIPESSSVPTSLSPFFIQDILRGELGFDGVVVTDALNAEALADFTPQQVALMAINAGNDQLLEIDGFPTPNGESNLVPAYEAVVDAVASGEIPLSRIEESVRRILAQKWEVGLAGDDPIVPEAEVNELVGTSAHLNVARKTARRSITLLKNKGGTLPLSEFSKMRILSTGWGQTSTGLIANEIASRDLTAQSLPTGGNPTAERIDQVKRAAREFDAVVVNTFNVWAPNSIGQRHLIKELLDTGVPVIVIALGTPYDYAYLPQVDAFIAANDFQPVSVNAAVAALFGQFNPRGKLPVTIPKAHHPDEVFRKFGFGLSYP
ncbi:MAG TPA: glycoside hydrolase family 3 protein [Solirubrobacterales bacterium]